MVIFTKNVLCAWYVHLGCPEAGHASAKPSGGLKGKPDAKHASSLVS